MKLKQTKQCKTCPWKKSATVADIPNYDSQKHKNLANTIADETGNLSQINQPLRVMACHYSPNGTERKCIGWVHNQLGNGNHIPLRMWMMCYSNVSEIEVDGEQKDTFPETFT